MLVALLSASPPAHAQFDPQELAKLVASDTTDGDQFGVSVAFAGDTAVVGALADNHAGSYSGSAYVFVLSGEVWTQQAKLTASDAAAGDQFGISVAISGDTVVVSAISGSAYVFVKPSGGWLPTMTQTAKLSASDPLAGAGFGCSVAVSDNTVVVGAFNDSHFDVGLGWTYSAGSAYVFVRPGSVWTSMTQTAKLTASDAAELDFFGQSVAMSGGTVVVGASDTYDLGRGSGSAYVFVPSGGQWHNGSTDQQAKLTASDATASDNFGRSVAISGDTVIVGAHLADHPGGLNAGSAYVFVRSGSSWVQQAKLTASDAEVNDQFGHSVTAWGDTVLVGAYLHEQSVGASDAGAAYLFGRSGTVWSQRAILVASDAASGHLFGFSVTLHNGTPVVGALGNDAAYVFARLNIGPPTADAGPDQALNESALVTLDGSNSSDPDSDPLTYTWTQLAGPDVGTLDTIDPAHPTFVAPTVPSGGATLTFGLIVNDGYVSSTADTVDITIKNVNHPPVADAGSDQGVAEESPVLLDGSASYDVDNDPYTFSWAQIAGPMVDLYNADTENPTFIAPFVWFGGEVLTFEVTVDDGYDSSTDIVEVIVENINHDPLADAGTDQTRNEGALVALDGTASSDSDGDWLMYSWTQTGGPIVTLSGAAGPTPTFTAPLVGSPGTLVYFQLTVDDGYGGVDDDEVVISIQDLNSPPACGLARPDRPMLWPPNHKLVKINILGVTDPENNHIAITVTGVTQDEPLNGLGDGDTAPDAVIQGSAVLLRAERAGGGNGRVYRIHFSADDGFGGVCNGSVTVCVPHDQGRRAECVDDGQIYNSLGS